MCDGDCARVSLLTPQVIRVISWKLFQDSNAPHLTLQDRGRQGVE